MADETEVVTAQPSSVEESQPETPAAEPEKVVEASAEPIEPVSPEASQTQQEPDKAPREGTPDKALQKLQQEFGNAQRDLQDLRAKVDAGEALSSGDAQRLQKAKSRMELIQESLAGYDHFDEAKGKKLLADVVETLSETDTEVRTLKQTNEQMQRTLAQLQADRAWTQVRTVYPDVDVNAIWEKACKDSEGYQRFGREAYETRASELFHERAGNAQKSVVERKGTTVANNTTAATGKQPVKPVTPSPVTRGGAAAPVRPNAATAVVDATPEQQQLASYNGLWKADN